MPKSGFAGHCSHAAMQQCCLTHGCGCGLLLGSLSTWTEHANGKRHHAMHFAASSAALESSIWLSKPPHCFTDVSALLQMFVFLKVLCICLTTCDICSADV